MNREEVQNFCAAFTGVELKHKTHPKHFHSYYLYRKKFAYFEIDDSDNWEFSIRVAEDRFLELTDQPGIKPSKYLARFHWITIEQIESVGEEYLEELILWSYQKAVASLPKKLQQEIPK